MRSSRICCSIFAVLFIITGCSKEIPCDDYCVDLVGEILIQNIEQFQAGVSVIIPLEIINSCNKSNMNCSVDLNFRCEFIVRFDVYQDMSYESIVQKDTIDVIFNTSNQSSTIYSVFFPEEPGKYRLELCVDIENKVIEIEETNNCFII